MVTHFFIPEKWVRWFQHDARLQQFGGQSSFECIPDLVGGVAETSELARCQAVFEKFLSGLVHPAPRLFAC